MSDVTVIIPAYNARETIGETLDSLREQTCQDFDVIVVDDGSTDGTGDFVQEYAPEVELIRQANSGPAPARNTGVRQADSEWIAFLDADDAWLPHRLALQLWFAERYPDVVLWAGQCVSMDYGKVTPPEYDDPPPLTWFELQDFAICNRVVTTSVLIRRDAFNRAGGFDPQFFGPEDYDLWIRTAAIGKVARIEFPLVRYRHDQGSISADLDRFLPHVMGVLRKNYSEGEALAAFDTLPVAVALSYMQCSYVAFQRGERWRALRLLLKSWLEYPRPVRYEARREHYSRIRLLYRYLLRGKD